MVNDSMKSDKLIGMIQPKNLYNQNMLEQNLHKIGCMGKITSFKKTEDNRYLIELKGLIRFEIISKINSLKNYMECEVSFENFKDDLSDHKEELKFSDLELVFKDFI